MKSRSSTKFTMALYINARLTNEGLLDSTEDLRTVESRAQATELIYGDAAYLQGIAQERWPDFDWSLVHVRTRKCVVKEKKTRHEVKRDGSYTIGLT